MKMKKSTWDAFMRRGASLFLVIAMLITSVTLPQIDWQKGEATTVHGTLASSTPKFVWTAETSTGFITSNNITTEFGYNEEETLQYLKVKNTTGTGVNMLSAYASTTGVTATKTVNANNFNISAGSTFVGSTFQTNGIDKALYASAFGNGWFNTHPAGIGNILSGSSEGAVDYSGIANNGQGLIHFTDEGLNGLDWVPPEWGGDGTRYAYILVKYKANGYVPRMRIWAYGNQYNGKNSFVQNSRVSDEGVNAYANNQGDASALATQEEVVFAERDFFIGDNNIQYQIIWIDVVNGGSSIGTEFDSFALEINGADQNDFGWDDVNYLDRQAELKDQDLLLYEIAGFESENDAIAYMYNDIYEDNGKFTEKAYRTETLINAPQKMAVGDTVKAHTNNLIPGAVLNRGIFYTNKFDSDGHRSGNLSILGDVSYLSSVYKTDPDTQTKTYSSGAANTGLVSDHESGHITKGNQGYIETLTYKVDSFNFPAEGQTDANKYYYSVQLGDASSAYPDLVGKFTGTIDITTPLEIVKYENDPSLSVLKRYTYGKTGHTYYQYDMDFAYMDARAEDTWSIENFIYYLRAYNEPAEHLHEDDPEKINDLPGYFHTSTGSMTYDLGPAISDNYESVDFSYNNATGGSVDVILYVTTYASIDDANSGNAIGTKAYTQTISKSGRGIVTFNIPKYETAGESKTTDCGDSSYVQNFAVQVITDVEDAEYNTLFDINNIVFAKRHTVDVTFKNEKDRDEHNAWDFNNKAIGVSHETFVAGNACGVEAHDGESTDDSNNLTYKLSNLACDAQCTFITYNGEEGTVKSGSEKVSVYAVQQSDYNFAYNINIGTVTGIDTENVNNNLTAAVGHINYDFSMYANTKINIKVEWQNYANNILAGMGLIGMNGEVEKLPVYEQTENTVGVDLSANANGSQVSGSSATGTSAPVITGVSYVKDSSKPSYYADGTVTVNLDPYKGSSATDIYMYYGDSSGTPLSDYMHFARQKVAQYAKVVEFDMVENTVIPAGAETLVIEARIMSGASTTATSSRFMIDLSDAGCTDFKSALGTPAYVVNVVSDTHIGKNNSIGTSVNNRFTSMLNDIDNYMDSNSAVTNYGIIIDGDITDSGSANEYAQILSLYNSVKNTNDGANLPQMFWTIGNHDMGLGSATSASTYLNLFYNYSKANDSNNAVYDIANNPYYYAVVNKNGSNPGALFIYLGDESGDKSSAEGIDGVISQTQINWLKNTLKNNHKDGMPIFVFFHQAVYNTVAGSLPGQGWDGIINHGQYDDIEKQLMDILNDYDEAMYFSGHSHWDLNSPGTYYQATDVMCNAFNTGSVGYLWSSYGDEYTDGDHYEYYESIGGSQGYYVEVYSDGTVLVRGRDFQEGKWLPSAQFVVAKSTGGRTDDITDADIALNKTVYEYGEAINIGYGNTSTKDWIGIYRSGAVIGTDNSIQWMYANNIQIATNANNYYQEGVVPFNNLNKKSTDANSGVVYNTQGYLTPGEYFAVILENDGYNEKSDRVYFTVNSGHYSVESVKSTYKVGDVLSFNYIAEGNVGTTDVSSRNDLYIAVSQSWNAPEAAVLMQKISKGTGSVTYTMPANMAAGTYQVRLFYGNRWDVWCTGGADTFGTFTVVEGEFEPTVSASKDTYFNGENVTLYYNDIYGSKPWIGIYKASDENPSSASAVHWTYINTAGYGTQVIDCFNNKYLPNGDYYAVIIDGENYTNYNVLTEKVYFSVVPNKFSVSLSNNKPAEGETVTITYTTMGMYTGHGDNANENRYVGDDNEFWIRIVKSDFSTTLANIKVGRVENGTVSYKIPEGTEGTYYVLILADEDGSGWCLNSQYRNPIGVFTVSEAYPTVTLDTTNGQAGGNGYTFGKGEDIVVSYTGSVEGYRIAIRDAATGETRQIAKTATNGTIRFNNSGTTDGPIENLATHGVLYSSVDYISLPAGNYEIVTYDASGKLITKTEDIIKFTIAERTFSLTFADGTTNNKTITFNEPISVNYSGTTKGYIVALFNANTTVGRISDALQIAYTANSGNIVFNNYYTDEYDNRVQIYDPLAYNVLTHTDNAYLFLGKGDYKIQLFEMVSSGAHAVGNALNVTITAGDAPTITPEIPEKKFVYANNEWVGVNYSGAGWGYWLAVYDRENAQYNEDGTYTALTNADPSKNGMAIMRAWINGSDMVEFNNQLNFSGTMDTGTSDDLPMLPRYVNGVTYINEDRLALGDKDENCYYTIIMFDDENNEVARFDITVTPPGGSTDDEGEIDPDNPVVGWIGKWQSEAGAIIIDVETGDADTNVIEYSTKKTFTAIANEGYKFVGWYDLSKDGTVKSLISNDKVLTYYNFYTSTITIYALFVPVEGYVDGTTQVTEFDVDFLNDAGQVIQSIPSINGSAVDLYKLVYTPPIKVGYTFDKWIIPDANTNGVTVTYYNTNGYNDSANEVSADSAAARYMVVKGDAYKYDTVYKVKTDADGNALDADGVVTTVPTAYVWEAFAIVNVTANVKIYGRWKPASGTTKSTEATIKYSSYDANGNKEEGSFSGAINLNAYVETAATYKGKNFIGWIDMSKDTKQSYTIENNSSKVEVDGETADGANVKIYANGNVLINGGYYPIVSYKSLYAFRIVGNMDLRAVYANGNYSLAENAKPAVTISRYAQYAARTETKVNVTVNAILTMPVDGVTNYEIVEYGYLYFMASGDVKPTTVFYDEEGNATEAEFLSFATEVKEGSGAVFSKKVINTSNSAGQYYGSVTTIATSGKYLYARPYAIYKTVGTDAENANWTIAYGETLKIDMGGVYAEDALYGLNAKVDLYTETLLKSGDYVNYNN